MKSMTDERTMDMIRKVERWPSEQGQTQQETRSTSVARNIRRLQSPGQLGMIGT